MNVHLTLRENAISVSSVLALSIKKYLRNWPFLETARLLQYKLFHTKLAEFAVKVNQHFHANGSPSQEIRYVMDFDIDHLLEIDTQVYNKERGGLLGSINMLGEGLKSIYALSLLWNICRRGWHTALYNTYGRPWNISSSTAPESSKWDFIQAFQKEPGNFLNTFTKYDF